MNQILVRQKAAHLSAGPPDAATRVAWIDRCIDLLVGHQTEIAKAINTDFGSRSPEATALTDVAGSIGPLKFARDNLAKWMRAEKRKTTPAILGLFGAKASVQYQPKGVVGVISPWNFPVNLTFAPLAGILAAGNRAMIKPSEFTPATSDLMKAMFAKAFAEDEIAVFTGGPEAGQAFAGLAFDHLVFTGATSVARHVMRAAAENHTPVTLELGGKSPQIVFADADFEAMLPVVVNA
ncbi:MAG: aldehyde dehydrogenase family protein, partial [bacterium]|nr:aldehyde dehydrogenase family protein [bacterium]